MIIVTGGAGFIGSNIVKTLRRKDSADFSKVEEYINKNYFVLYTF